MTVICEANALRGVHAIEHLFDELLEVGVELSDRVALPGEDRMRILHDLV